MFTTDRRLELHELLKSLVPEGTGLYFQPKPNVTIEYPAVVYHRAPANSEHAGNQPYFVTDQYEVTVIDRNPDSQIHRLIATLPSSRHNRFFITEGLNHDVYTIFF